jgi:glycosyltransferase involved in cell wall biosynthesis
MIREYHLEDQIHMLGNKDRHWVYEHLADYDLFIHPSRREGFGLSLVEAMAAGLPVIASNCDGPAEILEHGRYGILFENGSVESLAEAILKMIDMLKNGEAQTLAESAYTHALQHYSIHRTASEYINLYERILYSK